jgi:phospholipid-translocating ATPase
MLGLGAVLTQCDDEGKKFVVAYASRSNNAMELRYSSYKGECLAMMRALAHFRCYLFGTQLTLVTNHQPLKWFLMGSDKLTRKFARWVLILLEYDFQVVHRRGVANLDANGLSRNPCTSCRKPSLGLATKARCGKVADQVGDPGIMLPRVQRV